MALASLRRNLSFLAFFFGREEEPEAEVGVTFPQLPDGEERDRRATIVACVPTPYDDDAVLLKMSGDPPPLGPEQVAQLGDGKASRLHPFQSFGYRRLDDYDGGLADGTIQGQVPPRGEKRSRPTQCNCVRTRSTGA